MKYQVFHCKSKYDMAKMKRAICFFIVTTILSMFSIVYSESSNVVDFDNLSSLSDEILLNYQSLIEAEMVNRGLCTRLYEGTYLVGRDIPAGYYNIKYIKTDKDSDNYVMHIEIKREKPEFDMALRENYWGTGETKIYLEDGYTFYVQQAVNNGYMFIEKSSAIFEE